MSRLLPLILVTCLGACLDRERINASCQWSDPLAVQLDLRSQPHQRHLREDALIGEELGIRDTMASAWETLSRPASSAAVATVLVAPAVAGLWLAVGSQWAWLVEMLRLRDDHLSYRVARIPWGRHAPELFAVSLLLSLWIAWRRRTPDRSASSGDSSFGGAQG